MRNRLTLSICVGLICASVWADRTAAQEPTTSGIFLQEQATRGENQFLITCAGCHGSFDLLTPGFSRSWAGRSILELYSVIKNTMPETDPGMLSPEATADVVAYILSEQGYPAGPKPLLPVDSVLTEIPIEPMPDEEDMP